MPVALQGRINRAIDLGVESLMARQSLDGGAVALSPDEIGRLTDAAVGPYPLYLEFLAQEISPEPAIQGIRAQADTDNFLHVYPQKSHALAVTAT